MESRRNGPQLSVRDDDDDDDDQDSLCFAPRARECGSAFLDGAWVDVAALHLSSVSSLS